MPSVNGSKYPGGDLRDAEDNARLRHARERDVGFPVGRYLQPAPMLFSRDGHNIFLGDIYRGASCFLICSGPSLKSHDLSQLHQRGVLTCSVNNAASLVSTNLWVSVDDPGNFVDAIWRDPRIWKFVPLCHMEKHFTVRDIEGKLVASQEVVGDMPCVFGFRRNEDFRAEKWLHEDTFNWGNHSQKTDAYGIRGSRSVFLVALRLLFFLGIRRVFLLGCDFQMRLGEDNYAFPQDRSRSSVQSNNETFDALNVRLSHLKPFFNEEGFEVLNCTPGSGLRVFPTITFEEAIDTVLMDFPKLVETSGMYDRIARERQAAKQQAPAPQRPNRIDIRAEERTLPPITLITHVDESSLASLLTNATTWLKFHPALRSMTWRILVSSEQQLGNAERELKLLHKDVALATIDVPGRLLGHDAWTRAVLDYAAQHVATPWFVRVEPQAEATADMRWLLPEWFQPDDLGRYTTLVGAPWGYSKPASSLSQLHDWANATPALQETPQLEIPHRIEGNRVLHATLSSWLLIGNTAWVRALPRREQHGLPKVPLDTLLAYMAERRRDRIHRYNFKQSGWNHSFSRQLLRPNNSSTVFGVSKP